MQEVGHYTKECKEELSKAQPRKVMNMLILDNKSSHDEGKRESENDKDTDNEK